jgi:hypothetical protein
MELVLKNRWRVRDNSGPFFRVALPMNRVMSGSTLESILGD